MQHPTSRQPFDPRILLLALAAALALAFLATAAYAIAPPPPAPSSAIFYGQTITATLALAGQTDSYTFAGTAGEVVLSRMARTCCSLYPQIRLYAPGGALLVDSGSNMDFGRREITATLPSDGSYTLVASAGNGISTGGYSLSLQALVHPGNAVAIAYNHVMTETVSSSGEMDTYTFAGDAGQVVLSRMARSVAGLYPQIRLYAPDGALLANSGYNVDYGRVEITSTLRGHGNYTLIASNGDGSWGTGSTGLYSLSLQRLDNPGGNPGDASSINPGRTISATVSASGDMDAYTFAGDAGDAVLTRMARSSNGFYPQIRLYAPDGALLRNSGYNVDYGRVEITSTLPVSGNYTLIASNGDGRWGTGTTGFYSLSLQHLNNPGSNPGHATYLSFGSTISGTVSASGETDAYTFAADAGGVVLSRMARTCCGLYPEIRLYAPDGALLKSSGYNVDYWSREITSTLPFSGSYTLIASNGDGAWGIGTTGTYGLSLQCLSGVCYVPPGTPLYLPGVFKNGGN